VQPILKQAWRRPYAKNVDMKTTTGLKSRPFALGVAVLLLAASVSADDHYAHGHQHGSTAAHVHGEAELNLVVHGQQLLVEFISPLENLLGFEHAPQTAEQKQAYRDLQQRLTDYRSLFTLFDAECVQTEQHRDAPFTDEHAGHAEWHGEYHLLCTDFGNNASLEPQLFSSFPSVEKLSMQLISAKGQSQFIVSKDSDRIPLQ
jgi:hypothetical protein